MSNTTKITLLISISTFLVAVLSKLLAGRVHFADKAKRDFYFLNIRTNDFLIPRKSERISASDLIWSLALFLMGIICFFFFKNVFQSTNFNPILFVPALVILFLIFYICIHAVHIVLLGGDVKRGTYSKLDMLTLSSITDSIYSFEISLALVLLAVLNYFLFSQKTKGILEKLFAIEESFIPSSHILSYMIPLIIVFCAIVGTYYVLDYTKEKSLLVIKKFYSLIKIDEKQYCILDCVGDDKYLVCEIEVCETKVSKAKAKEKVKKLKLNRDGKDNTFVKIAAFLSPQIFSKILIYPQNYKISKASDKTLYLNLDKIRIVQRENHPILNYNFKSVIRVFHNTKQDQKLIN